MPHPAPNESRGAEQSHAAVRHATKADISDLAALLHAEARHAQSLAGHYQLRDDFDWQRYAAAKLAGRRRALLVAELDGRLVGFIDVGVRTIPTTAVRNSWRQRLNPVAWLRRLVRRSSIMPIEPFEWGIIEGLFVDPTNRGSGIGRRVVAAGMAWFRELGIQRVELYVLGNNSALAFWERVGFRGYQMAMCADVGEEGPSPN